MAVKKCPTRPKNQLKVWCAISSAIVPQEISKGWSLSVLKDREWNFCAPRRKERRWAKVLQMLQQESRTIFRKSKLKVRCTISSAIVTQEISTCEAGHSWRIENGIFVHLEEKKEGEQKCFRWRNKNHEQYLLHRALYLMPVILINLFVFICCRKWRGMFSSIKIVRLCYLHIYCSRWLGAPPYKCHFLPL